MAAQAAGGVYRVLDWAHLVTVHALPGPGVLKGTAQGVATAAAAFAKTSAAAAAASKGECESGQCPAASALVTSLAAPSAASRGALLLSHMSSAGNLATPAYAASAAAMAADDARASQGGVVAGFIAQDATALVTKGAQGEQGALDFVVMTPGVSLSPPTSAATAAASGAAAAATVLGGAKVVGGDGLGQQYVTVRDAVLLKGADMVIVGRGILRALPKGAAAVGEEAKMYRDEAWAAYQERVAGNV